MRRIRADTTGIGATGCAISKDPTAAAIVAVRTRVDPLTARRDSATDLAAARLLTWKAADAKDRQERSTFEASMAKLAASEAAHRAADRAMQILASAGYRRGSLVERLFRDVRATEIYQGTSEAQRMIIAETVLGDLRI